MRVIFFLDWCPHGTIASDFDGLSDLWRKNEAATEIAHAALDEEFGHPPPSARNPYFDLVYRPDGIFIFGIEVPDAASNTSIYDTARTISLQIKVRCFGHRHLHHRTDKGLRTVHFPVSFSPPGIDLTKVEDVRAFVAQPDEDRLQHLADILFDDQALGNLRSISRRGDVSDDLALNVLDRFISNKHDEAIWFRNLIMTYYEEFRRKLMGLCVGVSVLVFVALYWLLSVIHGIPIPSFHLQIFVVSSLFAAIFGLLMFQYRHDKRFFKDFLVGINSYIGFLKRAEDFADIVCSIYQQGGYDHRVEVTARGYAPLVGSIEIMSQSTISRVQRVRELVTVLIVALGVIATVVAILGGPDPSTAVSAVPR